MTDLFEASNQWGSRPLDERFWTIKEAYEATDKHYCSAMVVPLDYSQLRAEAAGDDIYLRGKRGEPAKLTHYAFGQLAAKTKSPATYLRTLPPTLATQCVNYGIKTMGEEEKRGKLLLHKASNGLVARAALGSAYTHLWNAEVLKRCRELEGRGWKPPPGFPVFGDPRARPATQADLIDCANVGCQIREGDMIGPSGIYASDHDMFLFLVNDSVRIDDGTPEGLIRFVMLWNSEVGDKSFGGIAGLFKGACGNHICWGVKASLSFRKTHVGAIRGEGFKAMNSWLGAYRDTSAREQESVIAASKTKELGKTRELVLATLDKAVKRAHLPLPATLLESAYEHAERHEDRYRASPRSLWGMVQGITAVGKRTFADQRTRIDKAAGRILEMSF